MRKFPFVERNSIKHLGKSKCPSPGAGPPRPRPGRRPQSAGTTPPRPLPRPGPSRRRAAGSPDQRAYKRLLTIQKPRTNQPGLSAASRTLSPYVGMIQIRFRVGTFTAPSQPAPADSPFIVPLSYAFSPGLTSPLTNFFPGGILNPKSGGAGRLRGDRRSRPLEPVFITGGYRTGEDFSRRTRKFSAGILTDFKEN